MRKDYGVLKTDYDVGNIGAFFIMFRRGLARLVEPIRRKYGKTGRNAPCPCGAKYPDGRPIKFKHCCLPYMS